MVMWDKKYDFLVCGNAGLNKFIDIDLPLEIGRTSHNLNANFDEFYPGGVGMNIAYGLAKLGARVFPILALKGGNNLNVIKTKFNELGISMEGTYVDSDNTNSYTVLFRDPDGNHVTLVLNENPENLEKAQVMEDDWFKNSSMGVLGIAKPYNVVNFLNKCEQHKLPLAFSMKADSTVFPDEVLKAILEYSTIVFMNVFEKDYIKRILNIEHITDLFNYGNSRVLVVSNGEKGSDIHIKDGEKSKKIHINATKSNNVVDVTGAGDAYVAGFLFGLRKKKDIETCAEWGSTTSAFVIENYGCLTNAPNYVDMLNRNNLRRII